MQSFNSCVVYTTCIPSEKLSSIAGDSEDTESGFIESDRLDSGIPSSLSSQSLKHIIIILTCTRFHGPVSHVVIVVF